MDLSEDVLRQAVVPPSISTNQADRETSETGDRDATELNGHHLSRGNSSATTHLNEDQHFVSLRKFWRRQISLTVPHVACRDHLGTTSLPHLAGSYLSFLQALTISLQRMSARF